MPWHSLFGLAAGTKTPKQLPSFLTEKTPIVETVERLCTLDSSETDLGAFHRGVTRRNRKQLQDEFHRKLQIAASKEVLSRPGRSSLSRCKVTRHRAVSRRLQASS